MTLRDVGELFGGVWASVADGFHIATTEAFWDWPLWLSIPVGIGVPWFLIWMMTNHVREMRTQVASFWGTLGFGVGSALCAYVTYDVWFQMSIFDGGERALPFMRFGYPIMTTIFGFAFIFGVLSRIGGKRPKDSD
ncbi:hypothetical protein [Tabrizicola fusiformis]|uniref:hypothetical protein n=1 Tax=Tabrizicola sp. SY72 TaxID=2741673 RepID=UPI001571807A|nr:hypothetical protein [Tabrizicola sp. SY72]NTT87755.1 hypothetical protein [Tabrizicola sp. SY72]